MKSIANNASILFRFHPQGSQQSDELRRKRHEATRPNHILLFTIINPVYPITVVSTIGTYRPKSRMPFYYMNILNIPTHTAARVHARLRSK